VRSEQFASKIEIGWPVVSVEMLIGIDVYEVRVTYFTLRSHRQVGAVKILRL
jgi:hypothetical protein